MRKLCPAAGSGKSGGYLWPIGIVAQAAAQDDAPRRGQMGVRPRAASGLRIVCSDTPTP